jgi:hypothetical protein
MYISRARVWVGDGQPQAESLTRNPVSPATALAEHGSTQWNYWREVGAIPVAVGCFAMIFSLIFSLDFVLGCPGKMRFLCTQSSLVRCRRPAMIFCE